MRSFQKGFTLIELLVVIGIVGILLSITLVAINPARQFQLANNASRGAAVNTISSAIAQMIIDNRGTKPTSPVDITNFPSAMTQLAYSTSVSLGFTNSQMLGLCNMITGLSSINGILAPQTYIAKFPTDPGTFNYTNCGSFNTGYRVAISTANRVTVDAPSAELSESIIVTR
jgi:prepilin-type N-terminal cleavage/methylation domain-containing protein